VNESNSANQEPSGTHKKVDEDWKKQVEREKGKEEEKPRPEPRAGAGAGARADADAGAGGPQQTGFIAFVSGLAMQAMMCMGEMPDPNTGMTRENLAEAKYLIDIIVMLQEKTKGNLTQEEAAAMEEAVYGLRMRYVRKVSPGQQTEEA
jgi:hypothetical protein